MILLGRVRCRNFMGLAEVDLSLPPRVAVGLVGPNGSGKTSLLRAVEFALTAGTSSARPADALIRRGEKEAFVSIELLGEGLIAGLERRISQGQGMASRLTVSTATGTASYESEGAIGKEIERLTGLDLDGLRRVCLIGECAEGNASVEPAVAERSELKRLSETLMDDEQSRRSLARAKTRERMAAASSALDDLESRRAGLEMRLRLSNLKRAQARHREVSDGTRSIRVEAEKLEGSRKELRGRLDSVERRAAASALAVSAIKSLDALEGLTADIALLEQEMERTHLAREGRKGNELRLERIREALDHLDAAQRASARAAQASDDARSVGELERELRSMRARRATLVEAKESVESEIAGIKRMFVAAGSNVSLVGAVRLWEEWLNVAARGRDAGWRSRLLDGVATAFGKGNSEGRADGAPAADGDGRPPADEAQIAGLLKSNGHALPRDARDARRLIRDARIHLAEGAASGGETDAGRTRHSLKASDENLMNLMWRIAQADDRMAILESALANRSAEELERRSEFAEDEAESARAQAVAAVRELGLEAEPSLLHAEVARAERALREPEADSGEAREAESQIERLEAEAARARDRLEQSLERLREVWPEAAPEGEAARARLESLRRDSALELERENAVALGRALARLTSEIAAMGGRLERAEEECTETFSDLSNIAAGFGVVLEPDDPDSRLMEALPELRDMAGSDSRAIDRSLLEVGERIEARKRELASLESTSGEGAPPAGRRAAEGAVTQLEREAGRRALAARIATRAHKLAVRGALGRALDYARRLLPQLTDWRYFDLRPTEAEGLDLWDEANACWASIETESSGARAEARLAARLGASMAALTPSAPGLPGFLLVDGAFSHCDAESALRVASALSSGPLRQFFHQVIIAGLPGAIDARGLDHMVVLGHGRVQRASLPRSARARQTVS